ncbi:MAG: hypothetical protein DSZ09_00465 [Sulfurovum sp.]|nr:MAG: hypothetical protein DSZ08_02780 [Sulfurovum sp.]RUM73011.1 MAG: hypothetical protein DSZ09_00465 [Sulfurovum sp.]RUM76956.1 MAG: hypothetical protein DSZ12_00955 [Sulfurovum sp.]
MKKFFLYMLLILLVLGGLFAYVLYTEGAFESKPKPSDLKPFKMKCESGKCGTGKCAKGNN